MASAQVYRRRRLVALLVGVVVVAAVAAVAVIALTPRGAGAAAGGASVLPIAGSASATPIAPVPTPSPTPTFDTTAHSIDDPNSIWVVVNKLRPLNPAEYTPTLTTANVPHAYAAQLRPEAATALETMFAAFTAETGKKMSSQSSYRSYSTQKTVYNGYVASNGQAWADQGSARPGFSEHQTGLALDIAAVPATCTIQDCFKDTPQGQWLAAKAYKYGFILRYPEGLDAITGYKFEPWHYRYVGVPLATEMHTTGTPTLEQFFHLPNAATYAGG